MRTKTTILLGMICLFAMISVASASLSDGLVSHLLLNGSAVDSTGFINPYISDGATWNHTMYGEFLNTNALGKVVLNDTGSNVLIGDAQNGSMSIWFFVDSLDYKHLIGGEDDAYGVYELLINSDGSIYSRNLRYEGTWEIDSSAGVITPHILYNAIVTWNSTTQNIYLNGNLVATGDMGGGILFQSNHQIYLGSQPSQAGSDLNLQLNDFKFWNRTLSANEVMQNFNQISNCRVFQQSGVYELQNNLVITDKNVIGGGDCGTYCVGDYYGCLFVDGTQVQSDILIEGNHHTVTLDNNESNGAFLTSGLQDSPNATLQNLNIALGNRQYSPLMLTSILNWNQDNITFINVTASNSTGTYNVIPCENEGHNYVCLDIPSTPQPPQNDVTQSTIYQVSNSAGAGLGRFMQYVGEALPPSMLLFAFAVVVVWIAVAFKELFRKNLK